jgi:hypothetical protein
MYEQMFLQLQQVGDQWKKLADDQLVRAKAFAAEMGKIEAKNQDQAALFIDEWAKLSKGWLAYTTQLSSEWRKIAFPSAPTHEK